jgi:hypothetical protein
MTGALLAFLAALLAGVGARDQMLLAGLAARRSLPATLLVVAILTAAFAGMAAVVAGLECLVIVPKRTPEEPTRSLFAAAVVLLAHQLTDGARFLVFAIAVATAVPPAAALGGAAGSVATVLIGALAGEVLVAARLRVIRPVIGAIFLAVGAWLVLQALH